MHGSLGTGSWGNGPHRSWDEQNDGGPWGEDWSQLA